jgi:hypothetical protein
MDDMNRSTPMIAELAELAEEKQADKALRMPSVVLPSLESVIADASPFPSEALLLGLAEDGLPVLLNLNDPIPGPILIAADQSSGKTKLLQMMARAVELLRSPSDIQYGVITSYPQEWEGFEQNQLNAGVYSAQHDNTQEFLQSLFDWAHNNKGNNQFILLFIDDLESLKSMDPQTEQNLRWLLLRGPSRRVWPIVTINAHNSRNMESWLSFFRTRLFGRTQDAQDSNFIAGTSSEDLQDLISGSQFAIREGNQWLKFLSPSID